MLLVTFYITRHGETEWNTQKRMQGWQDSVLTDKGINNAILLGERLREIEFETIYSSPSKRTVATAHIIKGERVIPIVLDENLKEMNMGKWEGQVFSAIEQEYPKEFFSFWNAPHLFKSIGGESFEELKNRVLHVIQAIGQKHRSGNILIVTHSVVIKLLLASFKDVSLEKLWDPPYIHDTSLTIVEWNERKGHIVVEGDVSHWNTKI